MRLPSLNELARIAKVSVDEVQVIYSLFEKENNWFTLRDDQYQSKYLKDYLWLDLGDNTPGVLIVIDYYKNETNNFEYSFEVASEFTNPSLLNFLRCNERRLKNLTTIGVKDGDFTVKRIYKKGPLG